MKDRFDLETAITDVLWVAKDIDNLLWRIMDSPDGPMTEDDLANFLIGLKTVLSLRGEVLWDTYCQFLELDHYKRRNSNED